MRNATGKVGKITSAQPSPLMQLLATNLACFVSFGFMHLLRVTFTSVTLSPPVAQLAGRADGIVAVSNEVKSGTKVPNLSSQFS